MLGLINHCAQLVVSEMVLLIPLLFKLRRPGADSAKGGPTIEEENWSGLESVHFGWFRENLRSYPEKRRLVRLEAAPMFSSPEMSISAEK